MIYICADDYGLCEKVSQNIKKCLDEGALNKVSVFPNFDMVGLNELTGDKNKVSLHLNFVEGKCMADSHKLLADKDGNFKNTFTGLLKLSLLKGKAFEEEVYREIKAQVLYWKKILPEGAEFLIDSHQHTHIIPGIFKILLRVIEEENINVSYLRIPVELISPYIKEPSLYFTYSLINIVKVGLINFLWLFNKKKLKKYPLPTAYFCGVFLSGKMDERVNKILPHYINKARKENKDLEILFHPGFCLECDLSGENIVFKDFYTSKNRKKEFNTVMKLTI